MSAQGFDPEVVELLRTVVEDPHSTLIRAPKERLLRWAGGQETISPRVFELTKAEKHLAQAYREEAAHILHLACVARMQRPGNLVFVEKARQPDAKRLVGTAERLVGSAGARASMDDATIRLLGQLGQATASQLATASLLLVQSDLVRIAFGLSLHVEGQSLSALHVFRSISSRDGAPGLRSLAAEDEGMVYGTRGLFEESLACYKKASTLTEERIRPRLVAVAAALQAGRGLDAIEQARSVEANGVHGEGVDELIGFLRQEKRAGSWAPTARSLTTVSSVRERMPSLGRRICDLFGVPHE